ncbi:hypothetical protein N657DRAFT_32704 [Parathielavia appendiculata]|uniref:Uncharacterized protein n=1 Tax=Parathielavia appendiculata TaxID=2587402 RepID=A0AAN6U915_9PEZI|nr:hypothetical protein N657DRAFT_32704 [Parathielavia appendiculata]
MMKTQLRPLGLVLWSGSFNTGREGGLNTLRQISRFTSVTSSTPFTPSPPSPPSARASCRLQFGSLNRILSRQWIRRTAFSTGPVRRSNGGNSQNPVEGNEGTHAAGGKAAYPERLIIYHAGTGKTTFLACLKLTTLFVFGFFDMIMTPAYIAAGEPFLKTAGGMTPSPSLSASVLPCLCLPHPLNNRNTTVALCGLIPAVYVAWSTGPFVAAIHMHLPPYARWSRAILERFARTAPLNTRLDITTMTLIGKPRVSSMTLGDLRPESRRFGMVNYVRDTTLANAQRKWWRFRAVGEFNVQPQQGSGGVKTGWVWNEVKEGIDRRVAAAGEKGK